MPQGKKKCPSCSQLIYVKSTPDSRAKRLVTESHACEAEQLWASYHERQQALTTLRSVGINEHDLEEARERGEKSDADAVVSLLTRAAASAEDLHTRKMAFHLLATTAERNNQPSRDYLANAVKCELLGYSQSGVAKVEVSKPKPWPAAAKMVQLHDDGVDISAIAKITGYSVPTVERNLKTYGEDPRTGPQCDKYSGRVFSVEEALEEMPLPCDQKCICSWRPILQTDVGI
jgi:hypothetical protein